MTRAHETLFLKDTVLEVAMLTTFIHGAFWEFSGKADLDLGAIEDRGGIDLAYLLASVATAVTEAGAVWLDFCPQTYDLCDALGVRLAVLFNDFNSGRISAAAIAREVIEECSVE